MLENLKESPDQVVGWVGRARRFVAEARAELGRVTWPSRREVWGTTIVVIAVSVFFGLYLGLIDFGLARLMSWILGIGG
jgi:preprotein translocase subunit SecE